VSDRSPDDHIDTRLLVLGMAHQDGSIVAGEVVPVAEACGRTAEQVRAELDAIVVDDLFATSDGERYTPTAAGKAFLDSALERARLAYVQDAAGRGWDRRWHLVAVAPVDDESVAAFVRRLFALGAGQIQNGLYVSAHQWEPVVIAEAERLGVGDAVTTAITDELEIGGERDPRTLAARLWALDELAERYQAFIARYREVPEALTDMRSRHERLTEAEFMGGALTTVIDFQACFGRDPLLPPELLPRPWPGREARELVTKGRRLGMLTREEHRRPALFALFDEAIDAV
jgi:phenylacetic acid degradation operon negative regulatory protein